MPLHTQPRRQDFGSRFFFFQPNSGSRAQAPLRSLISSILTRAGPGLAFFRLDPWTGAPGNQVRLLWTKPFRALTSRLGFRRLRCLPSSRPRPCLFGLGHRPTYLDFDENPSQVALDPPIEALMSLWTGSPRLVHFSLTGASGFEAALRTLTP
jgi:hypothetical protein